MILDLLKFLSGRPQMKHPMDYTTLAGHPHFRAYLSIEPLLPAEGPGAGRSWFGGMPEIPESQAWPKDENGTPYVFLAQICCTDFPKDLWGEIGPRTGWLTYWVHPEQFQRKDLFRILHVAERGPVRHEGGDSNGANWRWDTEAAPLRDGPAFRKIPVRLVARKTPASLSLPKSKTAEPPALRPATWGGLKPILKWIEDHNPLPSEARPITAEPRARLNKIKIQLELGYSLEDAPRKALRDEAAAAEKAAWDKLVAARTELRERLKSWSKKADETANCRPLSSSDWAEFCAWADAHEYHQMTSVVVAPELPQEGENVPAPFCLLWPMPDTKSSFFETSMTMGLFLKGRGFQTYEVFNFFDAWRPIGLQTRHLSSEEKIPAHLIEAFLEQTRETSLPGRWFVVSRPKVPEIRASQVTSSPPVLPGLSEDGLSPNGTTCGLYHEIGYAMLDAYLMEDLLRDRIETLRGFLATEWDAGRTVGGLPFFGYEQTDPMQLQAYCSDAVKADHSDPASRASYGDILAKEPQCLMINLGSSNLIGWLWGDCSTLTLSVPRADIQAGRFDRINWMIDNG